MREKVLLSLLILLPLASGCGKPQRQIEVRTPEAVRILPTPPVTRDGSLWQDQPVASASLTSDAKARSKGDIVEVLVVERVDASRTRKTSTSKEQNVEAGVEDVTLPYFGPVMGAAASALKGNREFRVGMDSKRNFDGQGSVSDTGEVRATITTQVAEVLPNGNLVLIGTKEVSVSGEVQVVTLTGIARVKDVTPENTVLSTKLAEARVKITGSGPLDDAQRRTLVMRLFDWINLF